MPEADIETLKAVFAAFAERDVEEALAHAAEDGRRLRRLDLAPQ